MLALRSLIAGRPVAVYGCGNTFNFFHNIVLKPLRIKIDFLIDKKFTQLGLLDSISTVPSREMRQFVPYSAVIIIALGNAEDYFTVHQQLREFGYTEIIYFQDIYEYNLVYSSKTQTNQIQKFFQSNRSLIDEVREFFTDSESLSLFDGIISTHLNQKLEPLAWHPVQFQYFDTKLFEKGLYNRLLQIGAYDGDTLINLDRLGVNPNILWAFEPDENNFSKLKQNLPNSWKINQINLVQMAVSNRSSVLTFDSNNGPTSRVGTGTSLIKSIKLDDFVFEKDPSFIIIDVEGYEHQVLTGMKKTIRRCRPTIAIATYHFPTDILKIPKYITSIAPYKNLVLRNYSGCVVDTVMYFSD